MDGAFYGVNGWGIYGLNGCGIYDKLVGHLWLKWMGRFNSYCFWEICSKNTGLQGSTLSGPRMTTGFGPFELQPVAYYRKGRTTPRLRFAFEEPSFWLAHSAMGIHSAINIEITKQIGGGAQWVELSY